MTVISIPLREKTLIRKAITGNRTAQRSLYERLSPKMLGLCRQYIRDIHFAEDVMVSGFVRVFQNLHGFKGEGSFEGWVRRIMVNECIDFLRKQQFVVYDDQLIDQNGSELSPEGDLHEAEYLQSLIDALPEGYRMVFLLFAVEGYSHREIANALGISEGTSKSQLHKARKMLQDNLKLNMTSPRRAGEN